MRVRRLRRVKLRLRIFPFRSHPDRSLPLQSSAPNKPLDTDFLRLSCDSHGDRGAFGHFPTERRFSASRDRQKGLTLDNCPVVRCLRFEFCRRKLDLPLVIGHGLDGFIELGIGLSQAQIRSIETAIGAMTAGTRLLIDRDRAT